MIARVVPRWTDLVYVFSTKIQRITPNCNVLLWMIRLDRMIIMPYHNTVHRNVRMLDWRCSIQVPFRCCWCFYRKSPSSIPRRRGKDWEQIVPPSMVNNSPLMKPQIYYQDNPSLARRNDNPVLSQHEKYKRLKSQYMFSVYVLWFERWLFYIWITICELNWYS